MSDRVREGSRRPIDPSEYPHLEKFGQALRELRKRAGLTQEQLAFSAELTPAQVGRLERGERRTRETTISRIVLALVRADRSLGDPDDVISDLAALLGPAMAPPTRGERRERRRRDQRRMSRMEWLKGWMAKECERLAVEKAEVLAAEMVREWARTGKAAWWPRGVPR